MSNRWNHLSLICMARQSVRNIVERRIPKEARFCEEIINRHTKNTVRFNEKADSSGSFLLYEEDAPLVFVPSSHGNNEKHAVRLINHYLFQCDISFNPGKSKNTYVFAGISLQFYDKKGLLFRAEWDNKNDLTHPQPHWHFGSKQFFQERGTEIISSSGFMESSSPDFMFDYESPTPLDYERLHFAMCMGLANNKVSVEYTDQFLKSWLNLCMDLFDNQIKALSK